MIRSVKLQDAKEILDIYNYYIINSIVTFEEAPVLLLDIQERIQSCNSELPWIVYEEQNKILGYAYSSLWRKRSAYKRSVEVTIYLRHGNSKKGLGTLLYKELISQLIALDYHVIIGGISLPNDASIALHEKLGFEKVAHFKEVGFKFNQWIDVGYWELLINNGNVNQSKN